MYTHIIIMLYLHVNIKIQTDVKNSNKFCISYGTKAARVTKNSTVLLLVGILLSIWEDIEVKAYIPSFFE